MAGACLARIGSKERRKIREKLLRKRSLCWFCNKPLDMSTATLDHIIPISKGGSNQPNNFRLACHPCNHVRGNKTAWEMLAEERGRVSA